MGCLQSTDWKRNSVCSGFRWGNEVAGIQSTRSSGELYVNGYLENKQDYVLKRRLIVCVLSVMEWLVSNVATRILIRTYKFRKANKTPLTSCIFICCNPWHPFAEHILIYNGLFRSTTLFSLKRWIIWYKFLKNSVPSSKRYSSSMVQQPRSDLGHLTVEVPRSHTIRHTQPVGLLLTNVEPVEEDPAYTTNTTDKQPSPQRHSNPRSQQSSGRRTTPWTARPTNRRADATLYTQISAEIPVWRKSTVHS